MYGVLQGVVKSDSGKKHCLPCGNTSLAWQTVNDSVTGGESKSSYKVSGDSDPVGLLYGQQLLRMVCLYL